MSSKVITSMLRNVGSGSTKEYNDLKDIVGFYLTSPTFSFASTSAAALKANYIKATREKNLFPFPESWNFEDVSDEPVYATSDSGNQVKTRSAIKRFKVWFNVPMDSHKAMKTFNSGDLYIIPYDRIGNMRFKEDDGIVSGFNLSMISVEEITEATPSGDAPAITAVILQFADIDEWDEEGIVIPVSWSPQSLSPLTDVYVEQVGTATATDITLRVYANGGYDSDGAVNKIGIKGLDEADFTATTTAGVDQTAALAAGTMTDNENGTYTFIPAALATGTANLVLAQNLKNTSDLFDTHFGSSDGEAAITITA